MFTVLIPSFNRPELLRNALLSVSLQTVKDEIDCVIVSENGLNKHSEEVCREFEALLKIKFFFHEQQMPVLQHLKWVLSQVEQGYAAMLCDDDWWDIHHLQLAKESFLLNPDCVAYFGNHAFSKSMLSMKNGYSEWNKCLHFGKNDFINYSQVTYESFQIFLNCFLITPFHFSAMICEGNILKKSVEIFDYVHPTYADRILFAVISLHGKIAYNPLVTSIILFHPNMDGNNYNSIEWKVQRQKGSLEILKIAFDNGIDIWSDLNRVYDANISDDNDFIFNELNNIFYERNNLLPFHGINRITQHDNHQKSFKRRLKNDLKSVFYKIRSKI